MTPAESADGAPAQSPAGRADGGVVCKFLETERDKSDLKPVKVAQIWQVVHGEDICHISNNNSSATDDDGATSNDDGGGARDRATFTPAAAVDVPQLITTMLTLADLGCPRAQLHPQHLEQLCGQLFRMSMAGIVHSDIRSANVLVAGDGIARLIDFELAGRDDSILKWSDSDSLAQLNTTLPERASEIRTARSEDGVQRRVEHDWLALLHVYELRCEERTAAVSTEGHPICKARKKSKKTVLDWLDKQQVPSGEFQVCAPFNHCWVEDTSETIYARIYARIWDAISSVLEP